MRAALIALAACGSGGGSSTGSGSATASGSAPAPANCLPLGKWSRVHSFSVDATHVTVCAADRSCEIKRPTCIAYELATGKQTSVPPPAIHAPVPAYRIKETTSTLELCGPDKTCTKLPFRAAPTAMIDPQLHATVDPSGKLAVIAGERLGAMYLVDARTGEQRAKVIGEDRDGNCIAKAYFLGDTIYGRSCAASFPLHTDYLFRTDGTVIGALHGVVIPLEDRPLSLGGTRWAVHLDEGDGYLVFDAKTGERVRSVPAKQAHLDAEEEPEHRGPLQAPSGKLVLLGAKVTVSDPATGTVEQTWPSPFCAFDSKQAAPACP